MISNELLINSDKLHTTELGAVCIKRNLSLDTDDVVTWCKMKIGSPSHHSEKGEKLVYRGRGLYHNNQCVQLYHYYSS